MMEELINNLFLAIERVDAEHPEATPKWREILKEGFREQIRQMLAG